MNNMPQDAQNRQQEYLRISTSLQQLEEQAGKIQDQLGMIYESIENYKVAKKTIENIKDLEEGDQILVPIGNIVLAKARVIDPQNFIVNVGADISMVKDAQGTLDYLDIQIETLENSKNQTEKNFEQLIREMQTLEQRKNQIARELSSKMAPQKK
ncbi:MAG: prefoldin subunit alpha [Candidatus Lokiarchaeota archaeon]|nr:prefoldin subunit alpha [Candidatus Lokiarchaeota archaeon]